MGGAARALDEVAWWKRVDPDRMQGVKLRKVYPLPSCSLALVIHDQDMELSSYVAILVAHYEVEGPLVLLPKFNAFGARAAFEDGAGVLVGINEGAVRFGGEDGADAGPSSVDQLRRGRRVEIGVLVNLVVRGRK